MRLIDPSEQTPPLDEVIRAGINHALLKLNTAMPGIIIKYDALTQMATVQPALKKKLRNDLLSKPLPLITGVPVMHPRANGAIIHLPIKPLDACWVMFSQRSLDRWALTGGIADPADSRMFHISDAVCYPGCYPIANPALISDPLALTIQYLTSNITIGLTGDITAKTALGTFVVTAAGVITLNGTHVNLGAALPTDFVALASKVLIELTKVNVWAAAHVHPFVGVPPASPGVTLPTTVTLAPPGVIASTKVSVS